MFYAHSGSLFGLGTLFIMTSGSWLWTVPRTLKQNIQQLVIAYKARFFDGFA